ncbi:MAG TPA: enoyl-CoA hydratase/isomerase family protein [Haliangiales bacterium]|nr:enoyl-CoA hydratase/isomerase family protein [Haliangiales bacterium]
MDTIRYEKRDRMAFVTLNRPDAKNAIDQAMHDELCRIWRDFRDDDRLDVAILSGTGDTFCAGADLRTWVPANYVDATPSRVREIVEMGIGGLTRGLHRIYKPTIAAINGWALAAGLELALACDLRVASDRAMLGSFEARRGFHHGDGGIVRLVNTCGVGVAMQLVLTAEPVDAQRALQCNLVTKVVPHERLLEETELVARQIVRNSQRAVRSAKQTILDVIGKGLDDQLRAEAWSSYTCVDREEARQMLQRFYDKEDAGRAGKTPTKL